MANFNTHLTVALAVSTAFATVGVTLGAFNIFEMMTLASLGAIGGLLPDIDLDHSKVAQLGFTFASLFGASFALTLFVGFRPDVSTVSDFAELIVLWGVLVLAFKFGVFGLFSKFTRHRGAVHSIPYMAVLSLIVILASYHWLQLSAVMSWLFGFFVFLGAMVHLILDEIYSVNVYGLKLKKSFGTAFKFYDKKQPLTYVFLYTLTAVLYFFAPPIDGFLRFFYLMLKQLHFPI